ncbi:DUF4227 family protein [Bacillus xiapuensis]|uniref:DUF4227 family protein n=1 Tax=Bacillus xiapuensis TaxID=2014075 RepID=UPI000C230D1B|nr:DUF4227 family protein [Bacillus xiapuensis]
MTGEWKKTLGQTGKVFLLFTSLTLLFYSGLIWAQNEYEKKHRYDEPEGAAIKVAALLEEEDDSWLERLLLFYLDGE